MSKETEHQKVIRRNLAGVLELLEERLAQWTGDLESLDTQLVYNLCQQRVMVANNIALFSHPKDNLMR